MSKVKVYYLSHIVKFMLINLVNLLWIIPVYNIYNPEFKLYQVTDYSNYTKTLVDYEIVNIQCVNEVEILPSCEFLQESGLQGQCDNQDICCNPMCYKVNNIHGILEEHCNCNEDLKPGVAEVKAVGTNTTCFILNFQNISYQRCYRNLTTNIKIPQHVWYNNYGELEFGNPYNIFWFRFGVGLFVSIITITIALEIFASDISKMKDLINKND